MSEIKEPNLVRNRLFLLPNLAPVHNLMIWWSVRRRKGMALDHAKLGLVFCVQEPVTGRSRSDILQYYKQLLTSIVLENVEHCGSEPEQADTELLCQ